MCTDILKLEYKATSSGTIMALYQRSMELWLLKKQHFSASVQSRTDLELHLLSVEAAASTISPSHLRPQKRVSKNKLYYIEVIDENGSQVKVHYCGYGSEYDEWKPRSVVVYTKPVFLPASNTHPSLILPVQ